MYADLHGDMEKAGIKSPAVNIAHTVEPTYTAATEAFDNAVNQRMTLQWNQAVPLVA